MTKTKPKLEVIAPVFPVADVKKALSFYTDKLNFSIGYEWADEPDQPVRYAIVQSGNCEVHLTESDSTTRMTAYVFVYGVAEYYEAVKANGADIGEELRDYPWGMREFELADVDGNRLVFGEHLSRIEGEGE